MFVSPPPVPEPLPAPPQEPAKPRMRRLQLLQLAEHHCRWTFGDPRERPFYFCAADRKPGDPYCAFHMAKAFVKPRGR
jgi:GcrA cell cycle regulator